MKKTYIAFLVAVCTGASAYAQGTVFFANRLSAAIFAPVYAANGTTPLDGVNYSVQLFAGPDAGSLAPIGNPLPFRAGAGAGSWAGFDLTIPTVAPGAVAFLQARAWFNAGGTLTSFAAAQAAGQAWGQSGVFQSLPLGGGNPPNPSPNTIGNPLAANNIGSFSLVPEPSTYALMALGACALMFRRRK